MHAVYMKSLSSPAAPAGGGRYRLQRNPRLHLNVFSQPQEADYEESQYMEDSFCVGSDVEESGRTKILYDIIF